MILRVVKTSWNWNLLISETWFKFYQRQPPEVFFIEKGVLINFLIFTGKQLYQSLFLSCNFIKEQSPTQGLSYEFCKIFQNNFFTEHFWMTALYFAIIYSWQLSSTEKSLVGKKSIHISQGFCRFRFLFLIFFHFLW